MSSEPRPPRALHVLYDLERGGVQAWLLSMLESGGLAPWHIDLAVSSLHHQELRCDFEHFGARVFSCPRPSRPLAYIHELLRILEREGPYDVVHSHFDPAFLPLVAARRAGVAMRIAHSHRGCRELAPLPAFVRAGLAPIVRRLTREYSTHQVACSEAAGVGMFGLLAVRRGNVALLREGIRLTPEGNDGSYGLERKGSLVVLHVGRLAAEKNHVFLLRIFAHILTMKPEAELWLVGDGPLLPYIRVVATRLGVAHRVRFFGTVQDVTGFYAAADVMLLPSRFEGLPLSAVEAQAAGLPVVLATTISREVVVCPDLVHWNSLDDGPSAWAATATCSLSVPRRRRRAEILAAGFNVAASSARLLNLYAAR